MSFQNDQYRSSIGPTGKKTLGALAGELQRQNTQNMKARWAKQAEQQMANAIAQAAAPKAAETARQRPTPVINARTTNIRYSNEERRLSGPKSNGFFKRLLGFVVLMAVMFLLIMLTRVLGR
jgi:Fe2+ transport system protein B